MNAVIGRDSVLQKCADLLYDESRFSSGVPSAVYYPESTEDVREVVRRAARDRVPITPAGGQTGITGGSVPIEGCALVSFSSMGRVLRFAHETGRSSPVLDCQSGVTLEAIDSLLRGPEADASPAAWPGAPAPGAWFYPPDPTEMTAQLGGTVATNASGARSFMFGPTRNHVESLRIVLANGDTLSLRRGEYAFSGGGCSFTTDQGTRFHLPAPRYASPRIKNAAGLYAADGMDLVDLFIGSEGVLGMFTEIGVRLSPAAAFTAGLSFFDTRDNAFSFASFVRGEAGAAAIEYFDATALRLLEEHREEIRPPPARHAPGGRRGRVLGDPGNER
jgi:D-lactate dehydrogenase (cytochrome)